MPNKALNNYINLALIKTDPEKSLSFFILTKARFFL